MWAGLTVMNDVVLSTGGGGCIGVLAGFVICKIVGCLPAFLEKQWIHDASECLRLTPATSPSTMGGAQSDQNTARKIITVLAAGMISGWAAWHYGQTPITIAALVLAWGLLTMSLIDLEHQLLPDVLVLPLLWLGLIINSAELFTSLHSAVWGAIAGYLVLWSLRSLSKLISGRHGIGQGDLKLLAMLGAWGGWQILPGTLLIASVMGVVGGGVLLLSGKIDRTTPLPFGPALAFAGWLTLLYLPTFTGI